MRGPDLRTVIDMTQGTLLRAKPARRRRAVTTLYFIMVALPFMFTGFTLAVDISSMVTLNRSVRLAAETAAVAGSFQYNQNGDGTLNQAAAVAAARDTFQQALAVGAVSSRIPRDSISYDVQVSATSVKFNISSYTIKGFLSLDYFINGLSPTKNGVQFTNVSETATICSAGVSRTYYCGRPGTALSDFKFGSAVDATQPVPVPDNSSVTPAPPSPYPQHYAGHYPAHYPTHYGGHYPAHYGGHYPAHYGGHYPVFNRRR
jgi:hypothetical protein